MTQEIKQQARKDLMEQLADIEHKRWASWQAYFHSKLTPQTITSLNSRTVMWEDIKTGNYILHKAWVERWNKQIETPYAELSEKEKQSDRDQVEKYWHLIDSLIDKTISDYQTNYEQKHIASAVELERERIVGIVETLANPYPEDLFSEPPKGWEKNLDEWCKTQGFRIDNITANFARWQRGLTKKDIISLITNKSDINKDKQNI